MKEFSDDNFKFDENVRKFLKWLENTAGNGEIARYKQFLLFPCQGLFGKGLNVVQIMICVSDWVENIVGKGENAGYQHFLIFPHCFQMASFPGLLKVGMCSKELR